MGTDGSGGQIWQFRRHYSAPMGGVVGERVQGFWSGARGGGEKVFMVMVVIVSLG